MEALQMGMQSLVSNRLAVVVLMLSFATVGAWPASALDPADIYSASKDAVVYVEAEGRLYNGDKETSTGTGFFVSRDGWVITSDHVTFAKKSNYRSIEVRLRQAPTAVLLGIAKIVGADANDIGLLKVDGLSKVPFVTLGQSGAISVGEPVVVLGFPVGYGLHLTTGVVSAKEKENEWHTDAALNLGNSGGPVFGRDGRVIGVVSGGAVKQLTEGTGEIPIEGIKFFVPIDVYHAGLGTQYKVAFAGPTPGPVARAKTIFRSYEVAEAKEDHPVVLAPHSKEYSREFAAEPGYRIVSQRFVATSANHVSGFEGVISEGGRKVSVRFKLTSGPGVDRYRAWLYGSLLTQQVQNERR